MDPMRWAVSIPGLSMAERMVLIYLASRSEDGRRATAAALDVTIFLGIGDRRLRQIVSELVEAGHITRLGFDQDGTTYTFNLPVPAEAFSEGNVTPLRPGRDDFRGGNFVREGGSDSRWVAREGEYNTSFLSSEGTSTVLSSTTKEITPPSPLPTPIAEHSKPVTAKRQQPKREVVDPAGGVDLLGEPATIGTSTLLATAIETWIVWQKDIPDRRIPKIAATPRRERNFLAAWNGPLNQNMTRWRMLCRACTRSSLLAGKATQWDGATFDWVLRERNVERILGGDFREDYNPEPAKFVATG